MNDSASSLHVIGAVFEANCDSTSSCCEAVYFVRKWVIRQLTYCHPLPKSPAPKGPVRRRRNISQCTRARAPPPPTPHRALHIQLWFNICNYRFSLFIPNFKSFKLKIGLNLKSTKNSLAIPLTENYLGAIFEYRLY